MTIQNLLKNNITDKLFLQQKNISGEEINFIKECIFWLKYWCILSIFILLDNYIYGVPILNYVLEYLKLILFGFIIFQHSTNVDKSVLEIYEIMEDWQYKENAAYKIFEKNFINNIKHFVKKISKKILRNVVKDNNLIKKEKSSWFKKRNTDE